MFINAKNVEAELEKLTSLADACEYRLELVNAETHETQVPEPDAIKAGFIAGIVTAGAIALGDAKGETTRTQLIAGIKLAGNVYLEEFLAHQCAECDGVDNG